MRAEFQDHDLTHHVGLHVGVRIDQRVADPGLGGEVDDPGNRMPLLRDGGGHPLAIGDVGADEFEAFVRPQQGKPGFLEPHVVVGVQIVHAENALATREQCLADVKADEAGGPGHQDRHPAGYSRKRRSIEAGNSAKSSITASAPRACAGTGLYP